MCKRTAHKLRLSLECFDVLAVYTNKHLTLIGNNKISSNDERIRKVKISDEALAGMIKDCATSKSNALEILYKQTAPVLNSYAFNILRSEALSNEVIQDSFIQIWRNASKYSQDRGKPFTWLCMIVHSRAIDKLRAEKKHSRGDCYSVDERELEKIPSHYQPEKDREKEEISVKLQTGLSSLPINSQLSLKLTYLHGYSGKDAANELNTNVNTVKSWIRRGLRQLKNDKGLAEASKV